MYGQRASGLGSIYVERLQGLYFLWNETKGQCIDEWLEIFADRVDFRSLAMGREPGLSFTAPGRSKQDVRGYLEGLVGEWSMQYLTVNEYIAEDTRVCALISTAWTNKQTGKTMETPKVDVWRFENDRAVAFFEYYDTAAVARCAVA